ncbi:hypothetical protein CEXT_779791 [Caerostris extrusa]|uniref:Transmembrane protein n=1 Tax=Caerostris extrusa TaxID=172846 RepID=A0AAV4Y8W6_CAEEX|nr:hypothetical protein CEXT_779791 [Caerostris extrusa]
MDDSDSGGRKKKPETYRPFPKRKRKNHASEMNENQWTFSAPFSVAPMRGLASGFNALCFILLLLVRDDFKKD